MSAQTNIALPDVAQSYEEQLKTSALLLGYKKMPVSIEEFIESPYYLGKVYGNKQLYPYWKQKLKELFPNPITVAYPIVILTGAIGSGKSTFSKIAALYTMHKLDCVKDVHQALNVAKGKLIKFSFQHRTADLAYADFLSSIDTIRSESPYFMTDFSIDEELTMAAEGQRANKTIGSDVIFYVLSELNFIDPNVAYYKLDQAFKRWDSRFFPVKGWHGCIIVDSSARGDNSITDEFIKTCPYSDIMVVRAAIWEVKAHMGIYGKAGWFQVYAGDAVTSPFIIDDTHKVSNEMDPSRVLTVPEELRPHFIMNMTAALQDQAGWSTSSVGKLIEDPDRVKTQFSLPMYSKDIITVDFYNKSDKLIYQLSRYLKDIPEGKVIFPRFDIGLVNDKCGIAITYFDKYLFPSNNLNVKIPTYKTPLMVALSREPDQETSIYHLFDFIMDLSQLFEIGEFSADQFASAQLLQDLTREGINTRRISVDRTDQPYIYMKNVSNNHYWQGAANGLALKEYLDLRVEDGKVDHRKQFDDGTPGSKDIMDAVCGSVWSCYNNLEIATVMSSKHRIEAQNDYIKNKLTQGVGTALQDQLNGLY